MKKAIDVKSLIIGVLATALFFTGIGAMKSNNNPKFDTITAKRIKIMNSEGKVVVILRSYKGEGALAIGNKEGKPVAGLGSYKGGGTFEIANKEGKIVAVLVSSKGGGRLTIGNEEGKPVASLGSYKGVGALGIFNRYGKVVATVQADKNDDGAIFLYNKDGEIGWSMTGKK